MENNPLIPSREEAVQFAVMLYVGMPSREAILYFMSDNEAADPSFVELKKDSWEASPFVVKEVSKLQGGEWEKLSLDERIQVALNKQYAEKAYFLYTHNFSEVNGAELSKMQEARKVLEAKLAGTSGKLDPLGAFYDDIKSGKVKLDKIGEVPLAVN